MEVTSFMLNLKLIDRNSSYNFISSYIQSSIDDLQCSRLYQSNLQYKRYNFPLEVQSSKYHFNFGYIEDCGNAQLIFLWIIINNLYKSPSSNLFK